MKNAMMRYEWHKYLFTFKERHLTNLILQIIIGMNGWQCQALEILLGKLWELATSLIALID